MSGTRRELETYHDRRDFRETPEPRGDGGPRLSRTGNPIFVVQQHDANTMHWDFRLEVDGVLKSWAVPKGPSTDPREKRLAVRTEDHPLDYADFEGCIPDDAYGGGAVIVWDAGPYENLRGSGDAPIEMADALERGHIEVWLEGKKLRGGYALIHAKPGGKRESWLLVKLKDQGADARRRPTHTEPCSVISRRTIEEVAADGMSGDAS